MVDFRWGAEGAHEDAIGLVVLVPTDPPALLTSGGDRCVKAWTLGGRPQGMLLQGLAPHAPNPRWSFRYRAQPLMFCLRGRWFAYGLSHACLVCDVFTIHRYFYSTTPARPVSVLAIFPREMHFCYF